MLPISFGSDNHSGVHPLVMKALADANEGFCFGYGDDELSENVCSELANLFGGGCDVYLVMTGTGANVIALQSLLSSFNAVICAKTSHINVDECGAVQKFTQARLYPVETPDGKLSPELILPVLGGRGDQHHSQKKIVSITQNTEYGTTYTIEELKTLADFVHSRNMYFHIDGARLANAAAHLNVSLKEITKDIGADIVSFGGTKNGMMFGEAIISYVPQLTQDIIYYRKQATQLYSKHRFISAQFAAYLKDKLWFELAKKANANALILSEKLAAISQIQITQKVQANAVFLILPPDWIVSLQERYRFYMWDEDRFEARLMCSWNTTIEQIDAIVDDVKELANK